LLQEGSYIWRFWGIKLWVGRKKLFRMQLSIFAQLLQLCLARLSLQRTRKNAYSDGCLASSANTQLHKANITHGYDHKENSHKG
jgi:hypothetical protein